jgi:hypothetical protein
MVILLLNFANMPSNRKLTGFVHSRDGSSPVLFGAKMTPQNEGIAAAEKPAI